MNKISDCIKKIEKDLSIKFKPTRDFYQRVGIGQKRFQMLLSNKVSPTIVELTALANYFKVKVSDLYEIEL